MEWLLTGKKGKMITTRLFSASHSLVLCVPFPLLISATLIGGHSYYGPCPQAQGLEGPHLPEVTHQGRGTARCHLGLWMAIWPSLIPHLLFRLTTCSLTIFATLFKAAVNIAGSSTPLLCQQHISGKAGALKLLKRHRSALQEAEGRGLQTPGEGKAVLGRVSPFSVLVTCFTIIPEP